MTIIIVRTAARLNGEDVCEAFLVAQYVKIHCRGWGYISVAKHLPSMLKALGLISSNAKRKKINK
jgi:hypothetical protein